MSTATIEVRDDVEIYDGIVRHILMKVDRCGVVVELTSSSSDLCSPNHLYYFVAWEGLDNIEMVAIAFDLEVVKVFKVIISLLGKISNNRSFYAGAL